MIYDESYTKDEWVLELLTCDYSRKDFDYSTTFSYSIHVKGKQSLSRKCGPAYVRIYKSHGQDAELVEWRRDGIMHRENNPCLFYINNCHGISSMKWLTNGD